MESIEVICGQCHGRLRVEAEAATVSCPHCGVELAVPPECAAEETLLVVSSGQVEATSSIHGAAEIGGAEITVPSSIKEPDFRFWGTSEGDEDAAGGRTSDIDPPVAAPVVADSPELISETDSDPSPAKEPEPIAPLDAVPPAQASPPRVSSRTPSSEGEKAGSRTAFLLLLVYASAVTAICLGLGYLLATNRTHQLESLPDVVPKQNDAGEIAREIVPVGVQMPAGHRLQLGQSQRFGDLLVTPLRVTRETLAFEHFSNDGDRPPIGDVLKLWLRFENVGEEAPAFTPLDSALLFYRVPGRGPLRANNFLAPLSATRSGDAKSLIPIYPHPIESSWDLVGQQLGTLLAPGESWETFAPSEPGVEELEGTWVWRLQIRKGIASNGWGVTTLIEVVFQGQDIQTKAADTNAA